MTDNPTVSFVIPSYNYGRYIGTAIRSILAQTIENLEVIVVDDASEDGSVSVVQGFDDSRVRLLVNGSNYGVAETTNRAIEAARGEWIASVDADDCIAATRTEVQLAAALADPLIDVIGTYVTFVDGQGGRHPISTTYEAMVNAQHDFGDYRTWIGANYLCNSSTLVRRSARSRVGRVMPQMSRAHDYEFWTRALRAGCRFATVHEPLTFVRLHESNLSNSSPVDTMLEMSYAMQRNILPIADEVGDALSFRRLLSWVAANPTFGQLPESTARRLVGLFAGSRRIADFPGFMDVLSTPQAQCELEWTGQHCLSLLEDPATVWHKQQEQNWREAYERLAATYSDLGAAGDEDDLRHGSQV